MNIVGYARVSSSSQNLDLQLEQLADAGCEKVFSEKVTGTTRNDRQALAECLDWLREGDTLVVTRLDRLARSGRDLHDIIAQLSAKPVGFRCVQQGAVDTTSSMGKLILGILGAVAEFETDIRKERQREGIERAKAAGVYKGRKPTVDVQKVRSLREQGLGATAIATKLGDRARKCVSGAPSPTCLYDLNAIQIREVLDPAGVINPDGAYQTGLARMPIHRAFNVRFWLET